MPPDGQAVPEAIQLEDNEPAQPTVRQTIQFTDDENFKTGRAITQFLLHVTFPISILPWILITGPTMAKNQGTIPAKLKEIPTWFMAGVLPGVLFLFLVVALFLWDWVRNEPIVWLGVFSYALHRLAVGCKYGLMDDLVYHHLCNNIFFGRDRAPVDLLPTWTSPSPAVVKRCVEQSAARLNSQALDAVLLIPAEELAKIDELNPQLLDPSAVPTQTHQRSSHHHTESVFASPTSSVAALVYGKPGLDPVSEDESRGRAQAQGGPPSPVQPAKSEWFRRQKTQRVDYQQKLEFVPITVGKLVTVMVNDLMGGKWWHINTLSGFIAAFFQLLIPQAVGLALTGEFLPSAAREDRVLYGLVALAAVMLSFFAMLLHCFVLIGALDSYRRNALYVMLDVMLEPNPSPMALFHLKELGFRQPPVFLDLSIASNVSGWFTLRELIQDLGREFQKRASLYSAFATMLAAALTAFLLAALFKAQQADGQLSIYDYKLVALAAWVLAWMFIEIALVAYFGGLANGQTTNQRFRIKRIQFALEQEMEITNGCTQGPLSPYMLRLKRAIKLLISTESLLEFLDLTKPIKFLGFRADMTLVKLLVTGGSGILGLIFSLVR